MQDLFNFSEAKSIHAVVQNYSLLKLALKESFHMLAVQDEIAIHEFDVI